MASAYSGHEVGPGSLAIAESLEGSSAEDIVVTAIHEGCVGEAVAAIVAAEAAEQATDPALRALLLRISADETRHAVLAWRFVDWALERGGATLRDAARAAFVAALCELRSALPDPDEDELLRHGACCGRIAEQLRRLALDRVVAPCARALLADSETHTATFAAAC